jgi:hypothetical protein
MKSKQGNQRLAQVLVVFAVLTVLFAPGCDNDEGEKTPAPDSGILPDAGGQPQGWTVATVDSSPSGTQARMAIGGDGAPAVACFATEGVSAGPCSELGVPDPPEKVVWDLFLLKKTGGAWARETVAQIPLVGVPAGLSLSRAPDGSLAAATMTGAPVAQIRYCGANDTGFMLRTGPGAWTPETAVATSGEAATGDPASDYGDVVGYWPALAFDAAGNPAIAYKDVHAGGMQSDDFRRADLELAWRDGGAWRAIPVSAGRGAGDFCALSFDAQDRPVIAYYIPAESLEGSERGVWVARSSDGGTTWESVRIHAGGTQYGPAVLVHPKDGTLFVAFYDAVKGLPHLARLTDDAGFADFAAAWEVEEFGDHIYDEGYYLSLGTDAQGRVVAAYYRCVRAAAGVGNCDPNDDAAVFARREASGTWTREVIDSGAEGVCGLYTSLGVDPQGRIFVAYQCSEESGGSFEFHLRVAEKAP